MVESNLVFWTVCDDALYKPLIHLLSIVSFNVHFNVPCNKRLKQQH
jgi:hypothetical protein